MGKIQITRHDYVEYGRDCDGQNCIALFLRNHTEKFNGRTFLTYGLYKEALSSLKRMLKKYKDKADDLFLCKEDCLQIEELFKGFRTE